MSNDRLIHNATASEVSTRSVRAEVVEITVRGDLDLRSGELVQRAVEECFDDEAVEILSLNLGEVTFIDSMGLRVLLRARRATQLSDRALVLTSPSLSVMRLLEVTGMHTQFEIVKG